MKVAPIILAVFNTDQTNRLTDDFRALDHDSHVFSIRR